MRSNAVGLMTKYPEPGRVKRRLAATIGDKAACDIYRALLDNTLERSQPGASETYSFGAFVQPALRMQRFQEQLGGGLDYCMGQPQGDLGAKMLHAFRWLFDFQETMRVVLIGADIPYLGRKQIEAGFSALDRCDVVLGPTDDGGYYLIGMKKVRPELLESIAWGTSQVLSRSMEIAERCGLTCLLLEPLSDLDTAEDLRRFPEFNSRIKNAE